MPDMPFRDDERCATCGYRYGLHRAADELCPADPNLSVSGWRTTYFRPVQHISEAPDFTDGPPVKGEHVIHAPLEDLLKPPPVTDAGPDVLGVVKYWFTEILYRSADLMCRLADRVDPDDTAWRARRWREQSK